MNLKNYISFAIEFIKITGMNKLFTTLLLMVFSFISYAQELNITIGAVSKTKNDIVNMAQVKDKIYTIMSNDKETEISLMIYDQNLNLQKESQFFNKKGDGNGVISGNFGYYKSIFFKNNILHFFSAFETTSKSNLLLVQQTDLEGNFIGKFTVIDEIKEAKKNTGSFSVISNEDSTMFAVLKIPAYNKYANQSISLSTYKADLTKVNIKDIAFPYQDKYASFERAFLSNNGDIFLLMYVGLKNEDVVKSEDDDFYSIIATHIADNNPVTEYQMKLKGKNMKDVLIKLDNKNNQIVCTGFYSNIKTTAKRAIDIDGFNMMTISTKDGSIVKQVTKEFPQQLVNQLLSKDTDRKLKKDQGISNNYIIEGIYPKPDGSTMVTSEYADAYIICSKKGGCREYYFRNNGILINIDKNGEVQSFIDLPKNQTIINNRTFRPATSYLTMQKENEFVLIYNDHAKNQNREISRAKDAYLMSKPLKSVVTILKINDKGEIKKEFFKLDKTLKVTPLPMFGMKIGEGKYVMPLYNKKRSGLIKFEIK